MKTGSLSQIDPMSCRPTVYVYLSMNMFYIDRDRTLESSRGSARKPSRTPKIELYVVYSPLPVKRPSRPNANSHTVQIHAQYNYNLLHRPPAGVCSKNLISNTGLVKAEWPPSGGLLEPSSPLLDRIPSRAWWSPGVTSR